MGRVKNLDEAGSTLRSSSSINRRVVEPARLRSRELLTMSNPCMYRFVQAVSIPPFDITCSTKKTAEPPVKRQLLVSE